MRGGGASIAFFNYFNDDQLYFIIILAFLSIPICARWLQKLLLFGNQGGCRQSARRKLAETAAIANATTREGGGFDWKALLCYNGFEI
ncbi:MAG: hypothetical protein ACETWB_04310 [Anaerolineae bacterium]